MINPILKKATVGIMLLYASVIHAEVKLAPIFGNDMVLQQKADVVFRGTANVNSVIKINTGWNNINTSVKSDKNGNWTAIIATPSYGGPFNIIFSDGNPTILSNVLIGEVWFCSGQSNMEMPVKGFKGQPVKDSQDYIAKANKRREIRLFQQGNDWSTTPNPDVSSGKWTLTTPQAVANFSAAGYVFGDYLQEILDMPIGLIQCAWSMSKIESWMSRETLKTGFPEIELPEINKKEFDWIAGTPTLLWNAMVCPWKGFPVKGVIWYQGEANSPDPILYKKLFPAMVAEWRSLFNRPDMPFFYVQIAPWISEGVNKTDWADFRQTQMELLTDVTNTGMVTTGDIGNKVFIHFPNKVEVGKRFAYLALNKVYGNNGLISMGPIIDKYSVDKDGNYILEFKNGENGLNPENQKIGGFEFVDGDGKIYPVEGEILGASNIVKIATPNISNLSEIRYCYRNYFEATLFNNSNLPASPFKISIK